MSDEGRRFNSYLQTKEHMKLQYCFNEDDLASLDSLVIEKAKARRIRSAFKIENKTATPERKSFDTEGKSEEWKENEYLPEGWRTRASGGGKNYREYFLSPNGQQFSGSRRVLQYLIENKYPEQNIENLRVFMVQNGWEISKYLPPKWIFLDKLGRGAGVCIISEHGQLFESYLQVKEFMKSENYFDEKDVIDIDRLTIESAKNRRIQPKTETVDNDDDPTIPLGWKSKFGKSRKYFISPSGVQFQSRVCILQQIMADKYHLKEIEEMRENLVHDGWRKSQYLPYKWMFRPAKSALSPEFSLLTEDGVILRSQKAAEMYMEQIAKYD